MKERLFELIAAGHGHALETRYGPHHASGDTVFLSAHCMCGWTIDRSSGWKDGFAPWEEHVIEAVADRSRRV